jgi:hypothetical protein
MIVGVFGAAIVGAGIRAAGLPVSLAGALEGGGGQGRGSCSEVADAVISGVLFPRLVQWVDESAHVHSAFSSTLSITKTVNGNHISIRSWTEYMAIYFPFRK